MSTIDELRGLVEVVEKLEWEGLTTGDDQPACLVCGGYKREGHATGCKLASSLSRARVALPALLAVAEAARTFPGIHCDTEDAIKWASKLRSALARLDGEVG